MATTSDARPPWVLSSGIPPAHLVRAALRAASLIDACGSPVPAARISYVLYPSDALYPPGDLRLGERLLLDCGLLDRQGEYLILTSYLKALVALDENEAAAILFQHAVLVISPEDSTAGTSGGYSQDLLTAVERLISDLDRREAFLLAIGRKYDKTLQAALGIRGEEFVVSRAREELIELGRNDLAAGVRRVSELADDLGYDVIAPRFSGKRRLEVKTSGRSGNGLIRFFISRNEIERGLQDADWALVACHVPRKEELELVGWCRALTLEPYLPIDGEGSRWMSAELEVPITLFEAGLPTAV